MSIQVTGVVDLQKRLNEYLKGVSSQKVKTRILAAGAQKIRIKAGQTPTPKSSATKKPFPTAPHFYYRNGKREIVSGNLRKSMRVFKGKDGFVYIGPRVLKSFTGISKIGQTSATASGYYAHMLYKTASAFRVKIMEPALDAAKAASLKAFQDQYAKYHNSTGI